MIVTQLIIIFFFFQAEDGIRDYKVTGVQTCALPIFLTFACSAFAQEPETRRPPRSANIQQSFQGSVSQGTATETVIPLSIGDAIDREIGRASCRERV